MSDIITLAGPFGVLGIYHGGKVPKDVTQVRPSGEQFWGGGSCGLRHCRRFQTSGACIQ